MWPGSRAAGRPRTPPSGRLRVPSDTGTGWPTIWRATREAARDRCQRVLRVARHAPLPERGHDVVAVTRPGRSGAALAEVATVDADAGGPEVCALIPGCEAVLHFAGVPDPDSADATRRAPSVRTSEPPSTCSRAVPSTARGSSIRPPSAPRPSRHPTPTLRRNGSARRPAGCIRPAHRPAAYIRFRPGKLRRRERPARSPPSRGMRSPAIRSRFWATRRARDFMYVDDHGRGVQRGARRRGG